MRGRGSITFPSARPRVRARNASRDSEAASTGGRAELVPNNRREPYRGTPQSVGDVISGQVQATARDGRHSTQGRLRGGSCRCCQRASPLYRSASTCAAGALDEFKSAIPAYEAKVAELARMGPERFRAAD